MATQSQLPDRSQQSIIDPHLERRSDRLVTLADLLAQGIDLAEVRRRWPHAVQYVALDGEPVFLAEDLATKGIES